MAGEPHVAGQPASKKVADYALAKFKSFGLDARIEEFEAMMPWPIETARRDGRADEVRHVDQGAGAARGSGLATPTRRRSSTPTRPTATSTGEVVYVNYGMPADYER